MNGVSGQGGSIDDGMQLGGAADRNNTRIVARVALVDRELRIANR
ncbi:hypothetical protein [Mesorhizobium sp. M0045]